MGKLINRIPGSRLLISSLLGLALRTLVESLGIHFGVKAKENQDKVPTLYWLPKLHKNPIKQD